MGAAGIVPAAGVGTAPSRSKNPDIHTRLPPGVDRRVVMSDSTHLAGGPQAGSAQPASVQDARPPPLRYHRAQPTRCDRTLRWLDVSRATHPLLRIGESS